MTLNPKIRALLRGLTTAVLRGELRRRGYFVGRARTISWSLFEWICDPECPGFSDYHDCRYAKRLNTPGDRCPAREGKK